MVTDNAAYYTSAQFANWCALNSIQHIFIAPYQHQSVGLIERYHQTLIDRIRKLRLIYGGSWTDYLESAVRSLNEAVHSVTKFAPFDLWDGTSEMRQLAWKRTVKERNYRNDRRRIFPIKFHTGQIVLAWNADAMLDKLQPKWKGPYVLTKQLSESMWEAKLQKKTGRGRQPVLRFHVDMLQPFDL